MIYIACPLCASKEYGLLYDFSQANFGDYKIVKCDKCAFVFRNPQPNEEETKDFYKEGYFTGTTDYIYQDERESQQLLERYAKKIACLRKLKYQGRFLDIGCAFGGLLGAASLYYEPYGVEISPYAADYCQRNNLKVFQGTLEEAAFPDNFFDLINMVEVIEHLPQPRQTIKEIYRVLKSDGILVIKTSNIESFSAKAGGSRWRYLLPGHLGYFSVKTLYGLLSSVGFKLVGITGDLKPGETFEALGIQAYALNLLLGFKMRLLANRLIRGMTFFVRK